MDIPDNRNKTRKWIKNRFHEDSYTCSECDVQTHEELDWFNVYDTITIEDTKIIRTLIVPKKKKEDESKNDK